jgi:hypothetical protein
MNSTRNSLFVLSLMLLCYLPQSFVAMITICNDPRVPAAHSNLFLSICYHTPTASRATACVRHELSLIETNHRCAQLHFLAPLDFTLTEQITLFSYSLFHLAVQ